MSYQATKWQGVILMHFPKWKKTVWKGYILYNSNDMTPGKDAAEDAEKMNGCLGSPERGKG